MRKLQRNIALIAVLCLWSASGPLMALAQSGIATNQPIIIQLKQPALFDYRRQAFPQADGGLRPLAQAEQKSLLAYQSQIQSTQDQLIRDLNARGLSLKVSYRYTRLFNGVAVLAPSNRIKEILKLPGVKAVYPDHPVQATLEQSVPLVGAPTVWAMTDSLGRAVRGQGVIVAIVDTGIDYTHPDLGGCFGPGCRVVAGYDVSNDDADPMDDHSHGTHVAGIVGANGTVVGVAPEVTFYAFKELNASGSGSDSTVIAGI